LTAKEGARWQHYARNMAKHSKRIQMLITGQSTNEKPYLNQNNCLFVFFGRYQFFFEVSLVSTWLVLG
jgi:hypothetical protein